MPFQPGRYGLVYTDELRRWFRAQIARGLDDPVELERELASAEAEAAIAEIEITTNGELVSRAGEREWYRFPIELDASRVEVTKPTGQRVVLEPVGENEISGSEADKPLMKFVRR